MTTIPAHKTAALSVLSDATRETEKISIALFGDGGSGKSRFIVTAPGPIGVIPLNGKCRSTVDRIWRAEYPDKQIYFPKDDLIRHANPMKLALMQPDCGNRKLDLSVKTPECCAQHYYKWHLNRVKDAIWTMVEHPEIKTIAIDDGTQLYEDILFSHYGRASRISENKTAYGPPNSDMIDIINSIKNHKHLIVVNQAKEEYRGQTATGRDTVKGFKDIGYHVSVLAEMSRDPKPAPDSLGFRMSVRMCQENASLYGEGGKNLLSDGDIDFTQLALKIFGDDLDLTEYM